MPRPSAVVGQQPQRPAHHIVTRAPTTWDLRLRAADQPPHRRPGQRGPSSTTPTPTGRRIAAVWPSCSPPAPSQNGYWQAAPGVARLNRRWPG
jgi:hypothetical protein